MKRHSDSKEICNKKLRPAKNDKYCWVCHKQNELKLAKCATCVRSMHQNCIKHEYPYFLHHSWQCNECQKLDRARKTLSEISTERLSQTLHILLKRLKFEKFDLGPVPTDNDKLVNAIDFDRITKKVQDREYTNTCEFLADIRWIQHNSSINDPSNVTNDLVEFCLDDINHINLCNECYEFATERDSNFFTKVCSRKHRLVWAKVCGHPYEPAKIMKVNGQTVEVNFFGDHSTAKLSIKSCLGFSKEDPNQLKKQPVSTNISREKIMKEIDQYINNLKKAGEQFHYTKLGEKIDLTGITGQTSHVVSSTSSPISESGMENDHNPNNFTIKNEIISLLDKYDENMALLKAELKQEKLTNQNLLKRLNDEQDRCNDEINQVRTIASQEVEKEKLNIEKLLKELNDEKDRHKAETEREKMKIQQLSTELNKQKYLVKTEMDRLRNKYDKIIIENKNKKWCTVCNEESKILPFMPIFCSISCNTKWQYQQLSQHSDEH